VSGPGAPDRLFVYGTLMCGERAHDKLLPFGVVSIEPATVRGSLVDCGAFPGLVLDDSGDVHGELVVLRDLDAALPVLDAYEDAPGEDDPTSLYRRVVVTTTGGARAWAYEVCRAHTLPRLPAGRWRGARAR
jgi:gamma-glutamylcyclotransferase (GGCT)/AIG2-like uncharacterized protein YtfP